MSAYLGLSSIRKSFGEKEVLAGVSVAVEEGRVLALLGPSGSGKTTLLRVIAGFETPDGGEVEVGGQSVTALPPEKRRFGMVFQHYALFPHLSVGENVSFGIESGATDKGAIRSRVEGALERVDLAGFADRRIHEISGGQQQRVALARALAPGPRLLLLDEPLSNLDPTLRERTRTELSRVVSEVGITAVWVTHEQEEAFHVGDVVAVLDGGSLQQAGSPAELYRRPINRFVAGFVGRAGWLAAERRDDGRVLVRGADGVSWPSEIRGEAVELELLLRPEQLALVDSGSSATLPATLVSRRFAGPFTLYGAELESGARLEVADGDPGRELGASVGVALRDGEVPIAFPRRSDG